MKNIASKLVKVMSECSHITKNGTNEHHKYKYVTAEDVVTKVNSALTKNAICTLVTPNLLSLDNVTNLKGNIEHLATVQVAIQLIDSVSGEAVEVLGIGSGQDAGDKAVMKAQTAAIKYAYMMSFAIATGDDPEADSKTDKFSEAVSTVKKSTAKPLVEARSDMELVCADCGVRVTAKVRDFSAKKFGQTLCMSCQSRQSQAA